ncbi:MAG: beta-ketoacyl synthase N-terminal-like domain-containing protein [Candidatus Bipolaricaulota bacterium]
MKNVVITGIGMVTPLGRTPQEVLARVLNSEAAATKPHFETAKFDCPVCAPILDFNAYDYYPDNKSLRFMSRDAQLAVVAARLAMEDADLRTGQSYSAEDIALYGSTGIAGMTVEEITRIIRFAANEDGSLNLRDFGRVALKRVRPALSFKILANMPICFVSIFQNIKGPNAIYTPWEGNGAQAIAAGIRAIRRGDVPCALVGGCDVKTRELSFINLQQLGMFNSWKQFGHGCVPAEGAVFLVLEDEEAAIKRGKKAYAKIRSYKQGSSWSGSGLDATLLRILSEITTDCRPTKVFASGDGDAVISEAENKALGQTSFETIDLIRPKSNIGNLFAAAAAAQFALAAVFTSQQAIGRRVLANCFGYGTEQASFMLETSCTEL